MGKTIPLISSSVAGPLGVLHLPRLWSKVLLGANNLLPEGYAVCGTGFDQMVLGALGLDRDKTLAYLQGSLPSYPEFEKWVLQQNKGHLDAAEVARVNEAIAGYEHRDDVRAAILSAAGIADDGSLTTAVSLNDLDDWGEFHRQLVSG